VASAASVAIAGLMASGKSAISRAVAAELGWPRVSFGDEIRAVARERGRGGGLPELQAIGAELVAQDPNALCRRVLNSSGWERGMPLIVDGVRHVTVLEMLRGIVAPQPMYLVLVETPVETRRARLRDRGVVDLDVVMAHSTERDAAIRLPALADLVVSGDRDAHETADLIVTGLQLQHA
jgi:cytidylate kinase